MGFNDHYKPQPQESIVCGKSDGGVKRCQKAINFQMLALCPCRVDFFDLLGGDVYIQKATFMTMISTRYVRHPNDVEARLAELGTSLKTLLEVRDVAVAASSNATAFHAVNAGGTFSYQDGTWALRDRHVKPEGEWEVDRTHGIEAIANKLRETKIAFANVDVACDDLQKPKPRSKKGAGGEKVFSGDLFAGTLPEYAPAPKDGIAAFYLMVDQKGACELTRPVIKGGTFAGYIERIYLSSGADLDAGRLLTPENDPVTEFDPEVVRKK